MKKETYTFKPVTPEPINLEQGADGEQVVIKRGHRPERVIAYWRPHHGLVIGDHEAWKELSTEVRNELVRRAVLLWKPHSVSGPHEYKVDGLMRHIANGEPIDAEWWNMLCHTADREELLVGPHQTVTLAMSINEAHDEQGN